MLDDAASSDSGSFVFYYSSAPPAELDTVSLDSISITDKSPPTDGDLAEHARQCEAATANSDGWLREAPTVEAAHVALNDIGKVLRPLRKKGPGHIDPQPDPFTQSRLQGIQSLLTLYTHPSSSTCSQWKKA
ncbi:hypothetical protein B0H14DRAFT_2625691 [Mycena olivaceomarginata]|nr:hypothetical protein B0H14DRAFT_2625691 [Mycena olivaceomarginata]